MQRTTKTPPVAAKSASLRASLLLTGISTLASLGFAGQASAAAPASFGTLSALAVALPRADQQVQTGAGPGSAAPAALLPAASAASAGVLAQVRVGLSQSTQLPVLSVGLIGSDRSVRRGEAASFLGSTNYPAFIQRAELRLFDAGTPASGVPYAVVAANADGVMRWTPTGDASGSMFYVYRVYDSSGRFDESIPQPLDVLSAAHVLPVERVTRNDFGKRDDAALRSIPLGRALTLSAAGSAGAAEHLVRVFGQIVPSDAAGSFAAHQLVPRTCTAVPITATSPCGAHVAVEVAAHATAPPPLRAERQAVESTAPTTANAGNGMAISIDPVDTPTAPDNPYEIKVRTDASHVDPVLAVGLVESTRTVVRGTPATFVSYSNYRSLLSRGEVRIFEAHAALDSTPLAVASADADGVARWTPEPTGAASLYYIYRVYDRSGHFDETKPQELEVVDQPVSSDGPPPRPLFGTRDDAGVRTISFDKTMTTTVTGSARASDEVVHVAGQLVPVQPDGRFVSQQIVARSAHQVWITVGTGDAVKFTAMRNVEARKSDWFVVGQGDLTFVSSKGSGPAVAISGNQLTSGDHVTSRAAIYAKGTLSSGWKITGSLDTGENLLSDMFRSLDRKDPRQLLRRLNSNEYYPTYGDDSTLVEDAPTQGKFYLRVQKRQSSLLIGNFVADIHGSELAQLERGVFGAVLDHKSGATTSFGEAERQFTAFAADPGTLPGRNEFRGTGGSLYYLNRRDLTVGSERLRVEVRDRDTGIVLSSHDLRPQEDYEIDYFQGRVTLLRPLGSSVSDDSVVRDITTSGNVPVLVVRYEYTPAVGSLTGYTLGGRAAAWVGDTIRLGVTAQRETTGSADQTLLGADTTVRLHAGTYVKAEVAQTDGPGFGQANSVDGGLSFNDLAAPGVTGRNARAYRGEVALDFAEIAGKHGDLGKASAYFEHLDGGFGSNGRLTPSATQRWGASLAAPLSQTSSVTGKVEHLSTAAIGSRTIASGEIVQKLGGGVELTVGARHDEQAPGLLYNSTEAGQRTDGAVQLRYAPTGSNWSVHAFGQATIDRDSTRRRNDRFGIGAKAKLTDKLSLDAEVSEGSGGLGADVQLNRHFGNGSEMYLGYSLTPDRTDLGLEPVNLFTRANKGLLTVGARHRFSSTLNIHGENKIGYGGQAPSVVRSFGFGFDPTEHWSFTGTFEKGRIDDPSTGLFRRTAATAGIAYTSKSLQFGTNIEARFERGAHRDQNVWLVRTHASAQINPSWRALGRLNFAISNNETSDVRAADFVEGDIGFAYRPVTNDRLNLLARFGYFKDMGPIGQITAGGVTGSPKQKSELFSIDGNFDLTNTVTVGAKYGFRIGSVSLGRTSDTYVSSNTQLGVLRVDWRLVRRWDVLAEIHHLSNDRAGDGRWGGVAAIYRHLGNNVKIGVGYSFSDFSTDLSDQSYTSHGLFVNLLGKF